MNRGKIMSESERQEILEWIYPRMDKFLELSENKTVLPIFKKISDEYPHDFPISELGYDKSLPDAIWKIKDRIMEREDMKFYITEPIIKDFLTIVHTNGHIQKHKDGNYSPDIIHTRFNVFLELPKKGGATYYNGVLIEAEEGSYVLCKSGLHYHWSDVIEEGLRISISFGFNVPIERVNTIKSYEGEQL
jgi:hypothetical protein